MALLQKEIRQLWPIALLWLGIELIGWISDMLTLRVDEQSMANWCGGLCESGVNTSVVAIYLLFGVVTAYSLYPREVSDGTINFLHALPVSRRRIFFYKLLAAVLVLTAVSLISALLVHLSLLSMPESLRGGHYPGISIPLILSDPVRILVIVSYGILLSTMRIGGLVLLAGWLFALSWLETRWQITGPWNLLEMFRVEYHGQQLVLPWDALLTQLAISGVMLVVSAIFWSRTDPVTSVQQAAGGQHPWRGFLTLTAGFLLIGAVAVYSLFRQAGGVSHDDTNTLRTARYHFVYHNLLAERANRLAETADDTYAALADMIGTEVIPTIRANLMASSDHFAGQAAWKTLRMDITGVRDLAYYRHVLAHETVHVLQATESARQLRTHFNSVRFFIEGSAEYLTFEVLPATARRQRNWVTAATAATRLKIDFADLVDSSRFAAEFDPDQFYALGDLWTHSLVQVCGAASVGQVMRAFARPNLPPGQSGITLWRTTLQSFDCELTAVNNHWQAQVNVLGQPGQAGEQRYPAFSQVSVLAPDRDTVLIRARLEQTEPTAWPGRFSVRIRRNTSLSAEPDAVYAGILLPADKARGQVVEFTVPRGAVYANRFGFQLGYNPPDTHASIYDRWRGATVPVAAGTQ